MIIRSKKNCWNYPNLTNRSPRKKNRKNSESTEWKPLSTTTSPTKWGLISTETAESTPGSLSKRVSEASQRTSSWSLLQGENTKQRKAPTRRSTLFSTIRTIGFIPSIRRHQCRRLTSTTWTEITLLHGSISCWTPWTSPITPRMNLRKRISWMRLSSSRRR